MAFSPKDWAIVQAFFEQGLSLAEIVAREEVQRTGITDRGSISRKSKQEGWIKAIPNNRSTPMVAPPSLIYIITATEFGGLYKIGMTSDVDRRLAEMQVGCPFPLYAVGAYRVERPFAVELMLHSFFYKKRIRGEWFRLDANDLHYIHSSMDGVCAVVEEMADRNG